MELKISDYNKIEEKAISLLPNRVIEAFQPTEFYDSGYPTRVNSSDELWKYVDVMHEKRFESNVLVGLGGGLTQEEFDDFKRLTQKIYDFTLNEFDKPFVARNSVSRSFIIYRAIKAIYNGYTPTVFELGAGCGYLGALLISENWPYYSTDNAQAFYLYQNRLWNYFSNNELREILEFTSIPDEKKAKVVHIPWWNFFLQDMPNSVDLITCNHMLAEMNPIALKYSVYRMRNLLTKSDSIESGPPKLLMFEHWGGENTNTKENVFKELMNAGFRLIYHSSITKSNKMNISIFALYDNIYGDSFYELSNSVMNALKLKNYGRGVKAVYNLIAGQPTSKYTLPLRYDQNDKVESHLKFPDVTVKINQINDFYSSLGERKAILSTKDEEFYRVMNY
jgi:hypothetical protein